MYETRQFYKIWKEIWQSMGGIKYFFLFSPQHKRAHRQEVLLATQENLWVMTKKKEHFRWSQIVFSEIGRNSETRGGNASLPQGGWTTLIIGQTKMTVGEQRKEHRSGRKYHRGCAGIRIFTRWLKKKCPTGKNKFSSSRGVLVIKIAGFLRERPINSP